MAQGRDFGFGLMPVKSEGESVPIDPNATGTDAPPKTYSWRELISVEMVKRGDAWSRMTGCTLTKKQLDERFSMFRYHDRKGFTLWTRARIYFPVVYDGREWVGSVARHCTTRPEVTEHQGGG